MKLHTSIEAINKAISSIELRGKRLDADIHVAGVSVLAHIAQHSDTTVLDRLVLALPQGARKHAFMEWALAYGNVRLLDKADSVEAEAINNGRLFKLDRTKEYNEADAILNAWYKFKPEAPLLTAFDVHAATQALVKRYTKASKDGLSIEGKAEAMAALRALMQSLETASEVL